MVDWVLGKSLRFPRSVIVNHDTCMMSILAFTACAHYDDMHQLTVH